MACPWHCPGPVLMMLYISSVAPMWWWDCLMADAELLGYAPVLGLYGLPTNWFRNIAAGYAWMLSTWQLRHGSGQANVVSGCSVTHRRWLQTYGGLCFRGFAGQTLASLISICAELYTKYPKKKHLKAVDLKFGAVAKLRNIENHHRSQWPTLQAGNWFRLAVWVAFAYTFCSFGSWGASASVSPAKGTAMGQCCASSRKADLSKDTATWFSADAEGCKLHVQQKTGLHPPRHRRHYLTSIPWEASIFKDYDANGNGQLETSEQLSSNSRPSFRLFLCANL